MKIIHLSDLHLNPNYNRNNILKTEKFLKTALEKDFDHLTISGDISHDADKESLKLFRDLLKDHGLLDSKKTSITIGNHDIFGGVYTVKDLLSFPERCKITNFEKKVLEFVVFFEELFLDCYFPSSNTFFPFAKEIDDYILIGLNTNDVYSKVKNPFASNGRITPAEFEDLKKIFSHEDFKEKKKIILSHHHFYKNNFEAKSSTKDLWSKIEGYTLKLRGKKKLLKSFKGNDVVLILHGHSHENKHYRRMGIEMYNSGGSIDNELEDTILFNQINLSRNEFELSEESILIDRVPGKLNIIK